MWEVDWWLWNSTELGDALAAGWEPFAVVLAEEGSRVWVRRQKR